MKITFRKEKNGTLLFKDDKGVFASVFTNSFRSKIDNLLDEKTGDKISLVEWDGDNEPSSISISAGIKRVGYLNLEQLETATIAEAKDRITEIVNKYIAVYNELPHGEETIDF